MAPNTSKLSLLLRSLSIAGSLTAMKIGVFFFTDSMAILASAADSFMDLLISLANFIFVHSADKPADENHAYGHGKIESLAGLLQSVVIGGVALGVATISVRRIVQPHSIHEPMAGIAITVVAVIVSFWHVRNLRRSATESGSKVMAAEYVHYASDILVYLGVIVSLSLYRLTGISIWDPVISLLIVIYLMRNAAEIFNGSLGELLDEQLPPGELRELDAMVRSFDQRVVGYHNLRTRKVGKTRFIEFHVVLRGVPLFGDAHALTDRLVHRIQARFAGAVVTVHSHPEESAPAGERRH